MYRSIFKPILDFCIALTALLILIPLFISIYILLGLANWGQPLFYQPRPGKNNHIFSIIKFNTMLDTRDGNGKLLPDYMRITKLGNFLRRTSLDEIPQLINVVKGDMSLVGPRPLRVRYLPYYTERERVRHTVKPGITGLALVSGRNSISWDNKLEKDVQYVENLSFLLDMKILMMTIQKIFITDEIDLDKEADSLDILRSCE